MVVGREIFSDLAQKNNDYSLAVTDLTSTLSVLSIRGEERLNHPWRYEVFFTSIDKRIEVNSILSQSAALTFLPHPPALSLNHISSLDKTATTRTLYGVITEFSQIAINSDEAHYRVILEPRLALFSNYHYSAIYQNQSVISVVEEVLRRHDFTGIDYRLELYHTYPVREFITQWQEDDLTFIQRILADVGVWLRFESHEKHHCDVVVIGDYERGYVDGGTIESHPPSGNSDEGAESVWDIQLHSKTVVSSVLVQDYNYRQAQSRMLDEINTQLKDGTTRGTDYRYGEHYKEKGEDDSAVESGLWFAAIRHQANISQQVIIQGKSNYYQLTPGQRIDIITDALSERFSDGLIILSVEGRGDRTRSYEIAFTAIPFSVLKPYRPMPIEWPQVNGTVSGHITSPDNDTYGYMDGQGRYRVKLNFDIKDWRKGEESLWMRLAKPYAGNTYGFHFPLIDGTEVAIAFTDGNPDRPYIAYAMHDSAHPDHVTIANKHRNIIRTPANNKLRMDDKRGQEHIKLSTEYGKTQLNLGHLVDSEKRGRGEGFELRTDRWGAISAQKGLYITTEIEPKAMGKQLDMQKAISQLENADSIAKDLKNAVQNSMAHPADIQTQQQLKSALNQLAQSGIIGYSQQGIGLTSPENIQLSSGSTVSITAEKQADISSLKKITLAAGEALSLFAQKMGIKLFASKGKVEIQAQNDAMELAAKQDIKISSVDGSLLITASQDITLICGGSYIKISGGGIELGTSKGVTVKSAYFQKMGPNQLPLFSPALPTEYKEASGQLKLFYHDSDLNPIPHASYRIEFEDGSVREGVLDDQGEALLEDTPEGLANVYFGYSTDEAVLSPVEEFDTHDYSASSIQQQVADYVTLSPEDLKAYIDRHVAYTDEYIEIAKQKQGQHHE